MENTKTIGDRTFTFGTIPPVEAVRVQVSVARVIGEPLFKAFMDSKKTGEGNDESANTAGAAAIGLLLSKMDPDELIRTMETVFKYCSVDGKRVQIDATFNGRPKDMWQAFIGSLAYNFSDFIPAGLFASIRSKIPA